jgi:hypothetical protein
MGNIQQLNEVGKSNVEIQNRGGKLSFELSNID